jgi:glycosyltransferase involved in cell wall biosynthesis
MSNKIVIFRIVTSNYCVSTHLKNTLLRVPDNLQFVVIGENVEIFRTDFPSVIFHDIPLKRNLNFLNDIISIFKIGYLIFKFKPKVVHSLMTKAGLYTAIISFILRVDIRVHTFTGQIWATRTGIIRFLLKTVDRIICYLNTNCFTDSNSQSEFLLENGISFNAKLIPYFFNGSISGVDIHKFNYENLLNERKEISNNLQIKEDHFILGYIARKSIDKGCIDMLKIFSKILNKSLNKKIKLLFIGPDESNGKLSKYFESNPYIRDSIIELGFVNNHYKYLSICNLMCLPSHREGFGSIVIDAAAIGVPTIGYKIPGLIDSISDNYSGKLVPFADIDQFVDEAIELINNSKKLDEMSINARKFVVENFDANLVNQEMFDFYING